MSRTATRILAAALATAGLLAGTVASTAAGSEGTPTATGICCSMH